MCLFRPLNGVLGAIGVAFLIYGAIVFFACLPVGVVVPNAFDIILLSLGAFLIALHFGVFCCERSQCCLCIYRLLTGILAACLLVFAVLFLIPDARVLIVNETAQIIDNSTSGTGLCNFTALLGEIPQTSSTPLWISLGVFIVVVLQGFMIFVASCHSDAVQTEKYDQLDEDRKREALIRKPVSNDRGAKAYKEKHKAIFDKYKRGNKGEP